MSKGNGSIGEGSCNPFEPIRDGLRFKIPPSALEQLSNLAKIPAHYRPTFANSLIELFGRAHQWHRLAHRSIEMAAAANELDRIAKSARKLKKAIDKLSKNARTTFGLYALRLEQFGEVGSHEIMRNQIEDLLYLGGAERALQKVNELSGIVDRIASAAASEASPKPRTGFSMLWKSKNGRDVPHIDIFNRFVIEIDEAVRACNGAVRFEYNAVSNAPSDDFAPFLEAASPYLPAGFIPQNSLKA